MSPAQPKLHPNIRRSTDVDLHAIHRWLEQQKRDNVHGTFLCNWHPTVEAHNEGSLLVFVDPQTQDPVAYQWGGLMPCSIFEVRADMRGRGIGRALVEHCLALAEESGEDILRIHCEPSSSVLFWQAMGFQLERERVSQDRDNYAWRIMPRKHDLPEGDGHSEVVVEWYPQERKWKEDTGAMSTSKVHAVWFDDELELTERVSFCDELVPGDVVVRVVVDGKEWYCDKARYSAAQNVGVESCQNGYFVDTLRRHAV